jgi:hypothetical protein
MKEMKNPVEVFFKGRGGIYSVAVLSLVIMVLDYYTGRDIRLVYF